MGNTRIPTQITPRNHIQIRGKIPAPNTPPQLHEAAFFHAQSIIIIKYLLSARRFNFIHCLLCLLHSIFLRDTVRTTTGAKFRPPARRMDKHRTKRADVSAGGLSSFSPHHYRTTNIFARRHNYVVHIHSVVRVTVSREISRQIFTVRPSYVCRYLTYNFSLMYRNNRKRLISCSVLCTLIL